MTASQRRPPERPARPPASRRRRARFSDRWLLIAEGFFSGTATAAHNAFFLPLLVQLGTGSVLLGIYQALNGLLANTVGLLGERARRRVPNRRLFAAVSAGFGRALLGLVAVLLLFGGDGVSPGVLIAVSLASAALIGIGLPTLTTVAAETVPDTERGAFFANRQLAQSVGAALIAIGVAALLRQLVFPDGFTVAYLISGLAGLGSFLVVASLRRVRPLPPPPPARGRALAGAQAISPLMWRYSLGLGVLWFGAGMVGPVLVPFLIDDLGADASFIGLMSAVNAVVAIVSQRFWGRRVDRLGAHHTIMLSSIGVALLPVFYGLTPTYWLALLFEVVSGAGWAGFMLGNLNYALEVAPPEERTRYTSIANAATGIGAFAGPLVAGVLATAVDPRFVLLLAGAIRIGAIFIFRLAKPERPVAAVR